MELKSKRINVGDREDLAELCYEQGWSDGLPVVPPTESKVKSILEYLGRDPQEEIGEIPPRNGIATLEKIAINSVMAGCLPEYVPVVIAAVQAMLEEEFLLSGVEATTHACVPLTIVSGPIVKELNFNSKTAVFGAGSRANATVGRAIRLILWNIGGVRPGETDKATFAHPGRYSYCIAEDEDANPWEPLHVERGLSAETSAVSVFACDAPVCIYGVSATGRGTLKWIADTMVSPAFANFFRMGQMLVVIGPRHVRFIAEEGWSKRDVKEFLFENARHRLSDVWHEDSYEQSTATRRWPKWCDLSKGETMIPVVAKPEDIHITVAGGDGRWSACCPGWGDSGGFMVTKPIATFKKARRS